MFGLLVLAVVASYAALFWLIIKKSRTVGQKTAAVVIAFVIPFWDLPLGFLNFRSHCSQEGGTYIQDTLPASTTVFIDQSTGYRPDEILKLGYRAVEYDSAGKLIRLEANGSEIRRFEEAMPTSNFKLLFTGHQKLPWNLIRSEYVVSNTKTGSVVARQTDFRWRGLWWQVAAAPMLGSGPYCLADDTQPLLQLLIRKG